MRNLKGKVTMDLAEYNYLLEKAMRLEEVISLELHEYNDTEELTLKVNLDVIEEEIRGKVKKEFPDFAVEKEVFNRDWNSPSRRISTIKYEMKVD